MSAGLVIAVDGPAASGKGTVAARLGQAYGLPVLDTGLLYRAVGVAAMRAGADPDDPQAAAAVAAGIDLLALDDPAFRTREAGELASRVAVHPQVRAALNAAQVGFARRPGGAVLDGRDVGTVICPQAEAKLFVTASAAVRARRRTEELSARGEAADEARILADIEARDRRDAERAVAPLKPAPDAHLLDTSNLSIEAAFEAAKAVVESVARR